MSTIERVLALISEQQKGHEGTAVFGVGEQLKDICRANSEAANIVLQDLDVEEMSIVECEKKIKAAADEKHKKQGGNSAWISPEEADKIIREFYGIEDFQPQIAAAPAVPEKASKPKITSLF